MKHIKVFLFSFICLACFSCSLSASSESKAPKTSEYTDSIADMRLMTYYLDMKRNHSSRTADTALFLVDSLLHIYKDDNFKHAKYSMQKILFLYMNNCVSDAVDYLKNDTCKIWEKLGGPYYKQILEKRLLAMSAYSQNDTVAYKKYISGILSLVEKYISENEEEYTIFMKEDIKHLRGKFLVTAIEYIYYSYLIYGQEEADKRIREYERLYHIDKATADWLKDLYDLDFMETLSI